VSESLRTYLDFAIETAYLAGRLTLGFFQSGIRPDWKADNTPVTTADRQAEELIRRRIARRYPSHAIVGEEYGAQGDENASHRWFIDPIDGTRSFVCGVPSYAVLLGLEVEGQPRVGVACFPALNEMLGAASGEGCWWDGRRASVSTVSSIKQAVVAFSNPASFARHGRGEAWERIKAAAYYCAGWGDAYGYLLVATGRVDVMLDPIMHPWDCAPFPPILEEAGGYFGDWSGTTTIYQNEAMATNLTLLPEVLTLIGSDRVGQAR